MYISCSSLQYLPTTNVSLEGTVARHECSIQVQSRLTSRIGVVWSKFECSSFYRQLNSGIVDPVECRPSWTQSHRQFLSGLPLDKFEFSYKTKKLITLTSTLRVSWCANIHLNEIYCTSGGENCPWHSICLAKALIMRKRSPEACFDATAKFLCPRLSDDRDQIFCCLDARTGNNVSFKPLAKYEWTWK